MWRSSLDTDPPTVDIYHHGWDKEGETKYVVPMLVNKDVSLVPEEILKVFRCGCSSDNPCKSGHCSCTKSNLPCSTFCECEGGISCRNPFKAKASEDKDAEKDENMVAS